MCVNESFVPATQPPREPAYIEDFRILYVLWEKIPAIFDGVCQAVKYMACQ